MMIPTLIIGNANIYQGNNLDILPELQSNSVDSIVCDPPYELGFMGKSWDSSGIAYSVELWTQCLRVLKPGGHLLAFGGTRTWHRLAVAIEDAGFEIRDNIAWLYGSGFPKSHNVALGIDKKQGHANRGRAIPTASKYQASDIEEKNKLTSNPVEAYEAKSEEAAKWDGWGTALKPAHEPIVVARKPLIGTVAQNVLQHGTGALNIDATRIGTGTGERRTVHYPDIRGNNYGQDNQAYTERATVEREIIDQGRWPANIILDEHTAQLLDEQSGVSKSTPVGTGSVKTKRNSMAGGSMFSAASTHNDSGGASRFFYVAKASKRDRNEGLENIEGQEISAKGNGLARTCNTCGASTLDGCDCPDRTFSNPVRQNFHPTVKPTALMQYLIRLVTPDNGVVLDPFAGSGSTGKAAILEGKRFIGIELTAEYLPIIEGRLKHAYLTLDDKEDDLFE
jgi:site-specific DNA-methyltransferase (adenine-specific)